jgi:hypothetical protein
VENGDVLDIVVHQTIRVSDVIASDILDSDYLPVVFHIRIISKLGIFQNLLKNPDWERFQSLTSCLTSPRIKINMGVEADKAEHDFTAPFASAYKLLTSKVTLLDLNNDLPGVDHLLKHKQRLRKLWHETRDPVCKIVVNWVAKSVGQMAHRKSLDRWETKIGNSEVTSQAIWPSVKSLMKTDGPEAPIANSWSFRP